MRKRRSSFRKPYRTRRKKSILKNRFFWFSMLALIILGAIFYFFIFSSFFQIEKIIISGNDKVSKDQIEYTIEKNLGKKVLFFPTRSIFLVSLNKIKKDVLNNFPQIAILDIDRGFPDTLNVIIVERLAVANFCKSDNCFLLDKEGIIFEETQLDTELVKIIREKENDSSIVLGRQVIAKEYLGKILRIQRNISEEFEFGTKEFIILNERLNVKTDGDWEIYFDPQEDLNWQLTKLTFVLKEKILPENRKDLEYIELRFGDLASFKYR